MRWELVYSPASRQWLRGCERVVSEALVRKLGSCRENPHHFFERLAGLPYYKLRVGDYRVIADLQEQIRIIAVLHVGHRKKVYQEI
ncbi:MAG: type II toxin-antitoxin system RelE/ParE family toxin [Candidatus Micrarchaeota archaeon]